ncbi:hypothetical protein V6N12_069311 [Hibiscus sabdariffa]|uniref:Uncharacterized protein n=1 Tax=Hibiscus sabdariffa TaxID=183260 RepID=A0ABR2FDF8_9ROSI
MTHIGSLINTGITTRKSYWRLLGTIECGPTTPGAASARDELVDEGSHNRGELGPPPLESTSACEELVAECSHNYVAEIDKDRKCKCRDFEIEKHVVRSLDSFSGPASNHRLLKVGILLGYLVCLVQDLKRMKKIARIWQDLKIVYTPSPTAILAKTSQRQISDDGLYYTIETWGTQKYQGQL